MFINHNILHIIKTKIIEDLCKDLCKDYEKLWILFNPRYMNSKRKFNLKLYAICNKYKIDSHYLLKKFASVYNYRCYFNDIYSYYWDMWITISDLRICPDCQQPISYYNIEKHCKKQHQY